MRPNKPTTDDDILALLPDESDLKNRVGFSPEKTGLPIGLSVNNKNLINMPGIDLKFPRKSTNRMVRGKFVGFDLECGCVVVGRDGDEIVSHAHPYELLLTLNPTLESEINKIKVKATRDQLTSLMDDFRTEKNAEDVSHLAEVVDSDEERAA